VRMEVQAAEEGFAIESSVLSSNECDCLIADIAKVNRPNRRAGIRNLMSNLAVRSVASDQRLISIAKRFVGQSAVPFRATLFEKSGRVNWLVVWHQDTVLPLEKRSDSEEWGPWSLKAGVLYAHAPARVLSKVIALRIHLDASTELNGPLRVVPETHRFGVLPEIEVIRIAHARDSVECVGSKGSVIAMRPLLIHASSKMVDDVPRRVLHIEYIDSLNLTDNIRIVVS